MVINIFAPNHLDIADSYGLLSIELAKGLTRLGCYVNLFALGNRDVDTQDQETATIVVQPVRPATGSIYLGYPVGYARHTNPMTGPRVALTMFESSRLPMGWSDVLNQMHAVITPSLFCQKVFLDSGVTSPVHVVPLGISDQYKPAQRSTDRPFTFLAFLDRGARKGGLVALEAFLRAFGDDMDYRLILKGRTPKVALTLTNPNIEVIQQDMSEAELHELFLSADCLIDANKGEGFGLLGRQAAACGCTSLSTNWGGTADDLSEWGIGIDYTLVKADWAGNAKLAGQDLGQWAEVNMLSLVAALHAVANNRTRYQVRAQKAAAFVAERYTWQGFAENVLEIYRGVAG